MKLRLNQALLSEINSEDCRLTAPKPSKRGCVIPNSGRQRFRQPDEAFSLLICLDATKCLIDKSFFLIFYGKLGKTTAQECGNPHPVDVLCSEHTFV